MNNRMFSLKDKLFGNKPEEAQVEAVAVPEEKEKSKSVKNRIKNIIKSKDE